MLSGGFTGTMTSFAFNADENRIVTCMCSLQGGGEFEAVSGDDAIIVISGRDHRGGVFGARIEVMERRIGVEGFEFILVLR